MDKTFVLIAAIAAAILISSSNSSKPILGTDAIMDSNNSVIRFQTPIAP